MTTHRFFIAPQFINEERGEILCQSQKLVKQIRKVLRLENGDQVDVLDGQGNIYHCILANITPKANRDFFQAKIAGKEKIIEPAGINFTIAMPLIKPSRFEWALEKLTELGVDKIVPIALSRSAIKTQEFSKLTRWQKIIQEASEQCERACIPELLAPLAFLDWLHQYEKGKDGILRLICAERRTAQFLTEVLCNRQNNLLSDCAIAVGAAGGFSDEEIQAALTHGFIPVSLGTNILRSETAAIYALSVTKSLLA